MDRGALPYPDGAGFVKNLSKYVQESFTIKGAGYDILSLSEGKNTFPPANSFYTLFSFFHLFFLPSFSFCIGMRPVSLPLGKQGVSLCNAACRAKATNLSQHIQNLFIHRRRRSGILSMSMREAAIPRRQKSTDLLFLFYPPFSNLCSESAKRRCPVSPNGQWRFARASEEPDSARAKKPRACRGFLRFPRRYAEKAACAPAARKRAFSENLTKISQRQPSRALAKAGGMRYT